MQCLAGEGIMHLSSHSHAHCIGGGIVRCIPNVFWFYIIEESVHSEYWGLEEYFTPEFNNMLSCGCSYESTATYLEEIHGESMNIQAKVQLLSWFGDGDDINMISVNMKCHEKILYLSERSYSYEFSAI